jgi:hypothetical protein
MPRCINDAVADPPDSRSNVSCSSRSINALAMLADQVTEWWCRFANKDTRAQRVSWRSSKGGLSATGSCTPAVVLQAPPFTSMAPLFLPPELLRLVFRLLPSCNLFALI